MLSVPVLGKSFLFGDNQSVVNSAMVPRYLLKKRNHVMYFHYVREEVSSGIVEMYHISSQENPSDTMTNLRYSAAWYELMRPLL